MKMINQCRLLLVFLAMAIGLASCKKEATDFNYLQPSAGSSLTLSGIASTETGINARNSVYVDMSKDLQTSVLRSGWDLGFYCSTTDYKVILNHTTAATAVQLNKTDLTTVTAADVTSLPADTNTLIIGTAPLTAVDPVAGDFSSYVSNLVINNVAAADADNKVFLINRGRGGNIVARDFLKLKITRRSNGYTVTYGGINDVLFNSYDVVKDASFNFKYLSFTSSSVSVEPAKANWDFEWTLSTYTNAAGLPVATPDFVLINAGAGVTAAEVVFGDVTANNYANFTEAKIAALTFSGARDIIGTKWRNAATSSDSELNINNDRFYVIKDPAGNVYKLKFNGGSRGRPEIEYALLRSVVPVD
jgi:hypothetical protein